MKTLIIEKILKEKLIAIVRGVYGEDCINLAKALHKGGINLIEVTFDQAKKETAVETCRAISMIKETFKGEVIAGAGTVTSVELVDMAHKAGAGYIISPNTDISVIKRTVELGLVSMPGVLTPSEIVIANNAGADFVKLFPSAQFGPSYLKSVLAPLNNVRILAVGGINEKNVGEYMKAGAKGAGVGGNLVNKEWISNGKFDDITELAKKFVEAVNA